MNIAKYIFKNIIRRKGRFFFTLLGITIGMASFVTLFTLGNSLEHEVNKYASNLGANLVVTPKDWCAYDQIAVITGGQLPESLPWDVYEKVVAIDGITAVPYLTMRSAISNTPVAVTGILTAEMKSFRDWSVKSGTFFSSQDQRAAVIGSSISSSFGLSVGDTVQVRGEEFPIIAVLNQISDNDDTTIFLPLGIVHEIYEVKDKLISFVAVKVENISRLDYYIAAILDVVNVAVSTDKQLLGSIQGIINTVNIALRFIAGVALLSAAFGIINTMMSAASERHREIGILRAIGAKKRTIFGMFFAESSLYGFLGGILGAGVGIAASYIAAPLVIRGGLTAFVHNANIVVMVNPLIILSSVLLASAISAVSGLFPAWKASKLMPSEAMNHV